MRTAYGKRGPLARVVLLMVATAAILAAIASLPAASAFSDTAPLLAFTSRRDMLLADGEQQVPVTKRGASPAVTPIEVVKSLTRRRKALCALDKIAIVEVDGLSSHALQTLGSSSPLRTRALDAPAQLTFPHVSLNHGDAATEIKSAIGRLCKSVGTSVATIKADSVHDAGLGTSLDEFAAQNPAHLIVITSAPRRMRFGKRQKEGGGKDNSTVDPKMGLFHRYQFLSTGLLVGILVFAVILIPAAYVALGLLASIETPDKMGTDKSRSGGDRKSQ